MVRRAQGFVRKQKDIWGGLLVTAIRQLVFQLPFNSFSLRDSVLIWDCWNFLLSESYLCDLFDPTGLAAIRIHHLKRRGNYLFQIDWGCFICPLNKWNHLLKPDVSTQYNVKSENHFLCIKSFVASTSLSVGVITPLLALSQGGILAHKSCYLYPYCPLSVWPLH